MAAGLAEGEGFAADAIPVRADANRRRGVPSREEMDWTDPKLATRAVREYLEALDTDGLCKTAPMRAFLTDPQSRWTVACGPAFYAFYAFYAYSTNYHIDLSHGIVLDAEATPAHRSAQLQAVQAMIERVEARFALAPERFVADTADGAPLLEWLG